MVRKVLSNGELLTVRELATRYKEQNPDVTATVDSIISSIYVRLRNGASVEAALAENRRVANEKKFFGKEASKAARQRKFSPTSTENMAEYHTKQLKQSYSTEELIGLFGYDPTRHLEEK